MVTLLAQTLRDRLVYGEADLGAPLAAAAEVCRCPAFEGCLEAVVDGCFAELDGVRGLRIGFLTGVLVVPAVALVCHVIRGWQRVVRLAERPPPRLARPQFLGRLVE